MKVGVAMGDGGGSGIAWGGSLGTLAFVVSINWSCSCKCVVGGGGHCRERGGRWRWVQVAW